MESNEENVSYNEERTRVMNDLIRSMNELLIALNSIEPTPPSEDRSDDITTNPPRVVLPGPLPAEAMNGSDALFIRELHRRIPRRQEARHIALLNRLRNNFTNPGPSAFNDLQSELSQSQPVHTVVQFFIIILMIVNQ